MEVLAATLRRLKREFARGYSGGAHVQELIPAAPTGEFPADPGHLEALHAFAGASPIYGRPQSREILGVPCMIYEGDIGGYWLDSTKHGASCQPFYPTWLASAYLLALLARGAGCTDVVDVGSGDGRIAYCAAVLGMGAHGVEIDPALARLQEGMAAETGTEFDPRCADALGFDYGRLGLRRPAFVIGALPQMGGDMLAEGVAGRIRGVPGLAERSAVVLAGSGARRELAPDDGAGGWAAFLRRHDLREAGGLSLPATWTFDQDDDVPYVIAEFPRDGAGHGPPRKSGSNS